MDFDLFSCTYETLNNLKFNELQKLSSHFRVNRRWAKKKEIIEKILMLKEQEMEKENSVIKIEESTQTKDSENWIDGSTIFTCEGKSQEPGNEENRRLTYNITEPILTSCNKRLTFNIIKKPEESVLNIKNGCSCQNADRRLTYNLNNSKLNLQSQKSPITDIVNSVKETSSNEHLPQNSSITQNKRIVAKAIQNTDAIKLKISNKSIQIKKLDKKTPVLRSPFKCCSPSHNHHKRKSPIYQNQMQARKELETAQDVKNTSASNLKLKNEVILNGGTGNRYKKQNLTKTEVLNSVQGMKCNRSIKYIVPGVPVNSITSSIESAKAVKLRNLNTGVDKTSPITKPNGMSKMPDFSKIHQKRFEQMDSLHDYLKKKEDRIKKLFGASTSGIPIKISKNNTSVYQFKSTMEDTRTQGANKPKELKIAPSISVTEKIKSARKDTLWHSSNKCSMINFKENSRKQLHGVRTNKRFELQMKFRKI